MRAPLPQKKMAGALSIRQGRWRTHGSAARSHTRRAGGAPLRAPPSCILSVLGASPADGPESRTINGPAGRQRPGGPEFGYAGEAGQNGKSGTALAATGANGALLSEIALISRHVPLCMISWTFPLRKLPLFLLSNCMPRTCLNSNFRFALSLTVC